MYTVCCLSIHGSPDEVVKVAKDYAAKAADALKDIDSDSAGSTLAEWAGAVSANVWVRPIIIQHKIQPCIHFLHARWMCVGYAE
jgi:hypothetical protein